MWKINLQIYPNYVNNTNSMLWKAYIVFIQMYLVELTETTLPMLSFRRENFTFEFFELLLAVSPTPGPTLPSFDENGKVE